MLVWLYPRLPLIAVGFALLVCSSASAADASLKYRVRVEAGETARDHCPVWAQLDAGKQISEEQLAALKEPVGVTLVGENGAKAIAQAQIVRDKQHHPIGVRVGWIVNQLHAGKSAAFDLTLSSGAAADPNLPSFRFHTGEESRDLLFGGTPIYRYMNSYDAQKREETFKPFHHIYGFHGEGYITKGSGGKFPHHRGISLAWSKTQIVGGKSYDFWHCRKGESVRFAQFIAEQETVGPVFAQEVSKNDWVDPDGKAIIHDTRAVTAWNVGSGITFLDYNIEIRTGTDSTTNLGGDPQHAGFQFRAASEVEETLTTYIRNEKAQEKKDDIWDDCQWAAGFFSIKGNPYCVVHMDSPSNPRPVRYSTRPYGRFGAFFTREVKAEAPVKLQYRVVIFDAKQHKDSLTPEKLLQAYTSFTAPPAVSVERAE